MKDAAPASDWDPIRCIGTEILLPDTVQSKLVSRLWQFKGGSTRNRFFILLKENEPFGVPLHYLDYLSVSWQLKCGHIAIHAAGIIRTGSLYLFAGPSGAGKSTVSALSRRRGASVLDEDQILVYRDPGGKFTGDAWGYDVKTGKAPLRAVFSLVQDSNNRVIPLGQTQLAQILLARHNDVMGGVFAGNEEYLRKSLALVADIARNIPAYELHFRKSPDFWDVIDAELSL